MKIYKLIPVVLSLVLLLTGCCCAPDKGILESFKNELPVFSDNSVVANDMITSMTVSLEESNSEWPSKTLAESCFTAVYSSQTLDELKLHLEENDLYDKDLEGLMYSFPKNGFSVEAAYKGSYGNYDVFHMKLLDHSTDGYIVDGYSLFARGEGRYKLCVDNDVISEFVEAKKCRTCDGIGQISEGNRVACGICGGTGMQTTPHFDGTMWIDITVACGGCGGSGYTGADSFTTCPHCHGEGLVF